MQKTRKKLWTECIISLTLSLLMVLLFETQLIEEGLLLTEDGTLQFAIQSLMTIVLFATIPSALYLFRWKKVTQDLNNSREKALMKWGTFRMMLLCLPMTLNVLFYYLFGSSVGFFYMAVIYVLSLVFILPTKGRCENECRLHNEETTNKQEGEAL